MKRPGLVAGPFSRRAGNHHSHAVSPRCTHHDVARRNDCRTKNYSTVTLGSSSFTVDLLGPIVPVANRSPVPTTPMISAPTSTPMTPIPVLSSPMISPHAAVRQLLDKYRLVGCVYSARDHLPYQRPRPYQPPPSNTKRRTMTRIVVRSICRSDGDVLRSALRVMYFVYYQRLRTLIGSIKWKHKTFVIHCHGVGAAIRDRMKQN